LRDTAKRVGHGANYDMGATTLVSSMTEANVYKTQKALKLNKLWSLNRVAQYLLDRFHATYPKISGRYYPWVITNILKTKLLVGATGWTRYCFGDPTKDRKPYVAHPPQSINAMILNIAFLKVFNEIAMHSQHKNNFKLIAQIHDSILFQYRIGHEYLVDMVKERMEVEITVTSCDAKIRSYVVPAAICNLNAKYWSET
jgi:DNA polymerase I-like protein with 3'-5' exonuclease and polymerase domains